MNNSGLHRVLSPMVRRMRSLVARCVLAAVDADSLRQTLQVKLLAGEVADGVEHFESYGFTSHPLDGDGLFLSVGASRAHGVALAVGGKTYRLRGLKAGEVALYDDQGQYVCLQRDGVIEVNATAKLHAIAPTVVADCDTATVNASASVTLDTPETHITGNATIDGNVAVGGNINGAQMITDANGSMQDMRGTYNGHTHPENDSGGPTDAPNQAMG